MLTRLPDAVDSVQPPCCTGTSARTRTSAPCAGGRARPGSGPCPSSRCCDDALPAPRRPQGIPHAPARRHLLTPAARAQRSRRTDPSQDEQARHHDRPQPPILHAPSRSHQQHRTPPLPLEPSDPFADPGHRGFGQPHPPSADRKYKRGCAYPAAGAPTGSYHNIHTRTCRHPPCTSYPPRDCATW